MASMPTEQKHAASLISLRRSFRLRQPGILLMGIGMWLVIGVFGLLGPVVRLSQNAGWAYFISIFVLLPTVLSCLELRSWVGHSGGSYRLIRAAERNDFTFFAGWVHILGWAGLSAYLVQLFAQYTGRLIVLATGWTIDSSLLTTGLIALPLLFFVLTNTIGSRPPWKLGIWLISSVIVGLVVLLTALFFHRAGQPVSTASVLSTQDHFSYTVVLLTAGQWAIELLSETGDRRKRTPRSALLLLSGGALIGGTLALVGTPFAREVLTVLKQQGLSDTLYLTALAEMMFPGYGELTTLIMGSLVTAISWQVLALIMLRRFQVIGLAGWIPGWLRRSYTAFDTPALLILFQALVTVVALLAGEGLTVLLGGRVDAILIYAMIASMSILLLQLGVNVAAIMLGKHPRAEDRAFRLPLYPIIQATGAAISFLLLVAISWEVLAVGVLWLGLGALLYWQSALERMRTSELGRTVFQDAPDITSDFPVVVPVANPETAADLVAFGAAIARKNGGHVSVVQVLEVPDQLPLDSERVHAQQALDLLERVLEEGEQYGVPIEGVTRLSRSISQGILDTVAEEGAKALVLGWNAREMIAAHRGLGSILDELLENAPCDVIVVRGQWQHNPSQVIVPVAGGPHAPRAAELALSLTAESGGMVTLLNIAREMDGSTAVETGIRLVNRVRDELSDPDRVLPRVLQARSVLAGILEASQDQDIILLGASEASFLDRTYFGHLPWEVTRNTEQMVALVRGYTGFTNLLARRIWQFFANLLPTLVSEEQADLYQHLRAAARPNINYFVLITLSAVIATLGLLLNSPAVIIGAMLVAPLMSPIVAAALGIVTGDGRTLGNALTSTLQGVLAAIFIAIIFTLISPLAHASPEVLARTQPNLLDLLVALASGMAGAYAIARKEVGEALPGVAIAAALMPPVCTIGIGIALGSAAISMGALLLFVTNLVAIIFSSAVVFLLLGVRPPQLPQRQRWLKQGLLVSIASLFILSIPLCGVLYNTAAEDQIKGRANQEIQQIVSTWEGTQLVDLNIDVTRRSVSINGTLYATGDIPTYDINALENTLGEELGREVTIDLIAIQGTAIDSPAP